MSARNDNHSPLLRPFAWLLGYRDLPMTSRPAFRIDIQTLLMWSAIAVIARPGITQAIATIAMDSSGLVLALLFAAPPAGNLLSVLWAWLSGGRRLVRFIVIPSTLAGLAGIAVAFVPETQPLLFALLVVLIFAAISGVVTLRTAVWRANYPRRGVGNIVSRFTLVAMLVTLVLSTAIGWMLDHQLDVWLLPHSLGAWKLGPGLVFNAAWLHRVVFPIAGLLTIAAGFRYLRTRQRGQPAARRQPKFSPLTWLQILRRDRPYRQYIGFQMIFGLANMMTEAIFVKFLYDSFQASYFQIALFMIALPMIALGMTLPLAGRMLDKTNPMRVRTYGAGAWAISRLLLFVAAITGSLGVVVAARLVCGIGQGFGRIAFQIGHLHFAPRDMVEHYMGLHLSSLGLRGLIGPFLGIALWAGATIRPWQAPGWLGGWSLPNWMVGWSVPAIGPWLFMLAFVMTCVGVVGFWWMDRRYRNVQPLGAEAEV